MSFRFRRSKKVGPFRITATKSGLGVSAGVKGFRVGVGPRGAYTSAGIPGTGLYTIDYLNKGRKGRPSGSTTTAGTSMDRPRVPAPQNPWYLGVLVGIPLLVISVPLGLVVIVGSFAASVMHNMRPEAQALEHLRKAERLFARREVDVTAALAEVRAALLLDPGAPTHSAVYDVVVLATTLAERGEDETVLRILRDVHALMPGDPLIRGWLGLALAGTGRTAEAIPYLEEAARRQPETGLLLARAYIAEGRAYDAVVVLQGSEAVAAQEPGALVTLAEAFEAAGEPELAIEALQRAPLRKRNLDAALLAVHYKLGRLYEAEGDRRKALQHYRRVYSQDVRYSDVEARIAALS